MPRNNFEQQLRAWQRKAEKAMEATFKEASQDLIDEARTPRDKGGRLPVDLGFLRNSFVADTNTIPMGPTASDGTPQTFDPQPIILAINSAKLGDRLVIGSAANYAKIQEMKNGFVRLTAQNWDIICERAARRVRRAIR